MFKSARISFAIACAAIACFATAANAVPPVFTYQGQLVFDGEPVQGNADFIATLFDGNTLIASESKVNVTVNQGRFRLDLEFDPALFDGTNYTLEIQTRFPQGSGPYTTLSPRQPIRTNPYAYTADTLQTPAVINNNTADAEQPALAVTSDNTFGLQGLIIPSALIVDSEDHPVGLAATGDTFGIAGFVAQGAGPFGAAIIAQVDNLAPTSQDAFQAFHAPSGNVAILGTNERAADFFGNVNINGQLTQNYTNNSTNLATPIAYGHINSNGNTISGTPNFSSVYSTASEQYEIAIDNENYFFQDYTTIVTSTSGPLVPTTFSVAGRLSVKLWLRDSNADVRGGFHFIVYKNQTAGARPARPALQPLPAGTQPDAPTDRRTNTTTPLQTLAQPINITRD